MFSAISLIAQGCYVGVHEGPGIGEDPVAEPDGEDEPQSEDDPPVAECAPPVARIWKLSPRQYDASLRRVLPGAESADLPDLGTDERWFTNESDHNDLPLEIIRPLFRHIEAEVERVAEDPGVLAPCLADGVLADEACLDQALHDLLQNAYRRPATPAEVDELVDFVHDRAGVDGPAVALGDAVHAVLSSPSFLFRTELGPQGSEELVELDRFEKASALSYFLADGPPDAILWAAAVSGELDDPQALATHARRLLLQPGPRSGIGEFFADYTRTRDIGELAPSPVEYDFFTSELAADMETEFQAFVSHVITQDDARLQTLLTAPYSILSPALAQMYGVPTDGVEWGEDGWAWVPMPTEQRAGLITNPAVLARGAKFDHGDPVSRGVFIRERLLCQTLPPAPPDVPPIPKWDGTTTQRDRLAQHGADPYCATCHRLIDPLGLPLEHYDAVGRYREDDHGLPIDPSGTVSGVAAGDIPVRDAIEMAQVLAEQPEVSECFVQAVFHYAYGHAPTQTDACELQRLSDNFTANDGDIVELVVDIVTSDHFITRRRNP